VILHYGFMQQPRFFEGIEARLRAGQAACIDLTYIPITSSARHHPQRDIPACGCGGNVFRFPARNSDAPCFSRVPPAGRRFVHLDRDLRQSNIGARANSKANFYSLLAIPLFRRPPCRFRVPADMLDVHQHARLRRYPKHDDCLVGRPAIRCPRRTRIICPLSVTSMIFHCPRLGK